MNLPGDPPVIAIVGAGEMGAAVGRRLREAGARVLISLNGRSATSTDRVRRAGLEGFHGDQRLTDGIDYILSIVPPAAALEVAERLRAPLRNAAPALCRLQCDCTHDNATHRATARTAPCHRRRHYRRTAGSRFAESVRWTALLRLRAARSSARRSHPLRPRYRRDGRAYRRRVGS